MIVATRLYRFYRRCGMTHRRAVARALAAVWRDFQLTRGIIR